MIYDALIAPFTEFEFMRRALAAVIALSLGGAPIGVFLMLRRMSLVGDAMAHAILPGAAIGFLLSGLNLFAMTTGGLIAGFTVAILAGLVTRTTGLKEDASLATFYLTSLALGLVIGSIAGYYGGGVDRFVNVVLMNAFLSFPGILLAIAFVAFRGPGIFNLVLALSLGGWVGYARLVRGQVLATREKEFVEAARALGASDLRIIVRHILPNIIQPVIVQSAIGMAGAILAEATMSFLGLGVPPPTASWGTMLNDGRAHLFDAPHLVLFPALTVMLAVLSFNFIGDGLRDLLDPRSRIEASL